jgi:hypothetical protein
MLSCNESLCFCPRNNSAEPPLVAPQQQRHAILHHSKILLPFSFHNHLCLGLQKKCSPDPVLLFSVSPNLSAIPASGSHLSLTSVTQTRDTSEGVPEGPPPPYSLIFVLSLAWGLGTFLCYLPWTTPTLAHLRQVFINALVTGRVSKASDSEMVFND